MVITMENSTAKFNVWDGKSSYHLVLPSQVCVSSGFRASNGCCMDQLIITTVTIL